MDDDAWESLVAVFLTSLFLTARFLSLFTRLILTPETGQFDRHYLPIDP
jgi:hypothetical protein